MNILIQSNTKNMNILIQSKSDSTRQMIRSAKLAWQPCMKTVTFLSQRMDRETSESAADRGRATVVSYRSLAGEWGTAALVSWWKGKAEGRDSDGDGARPYLP